MSKIAILSDSHDQVANMAAAIRFCNENSIETVIHCGDLISPFMLQQLTKLQGVVHLIYGNNVGDQHLISSRCKNTYENIFHHGIMAELDIYNKKIAAVHYPEVARGLASQSSYDIVCFGHNHTFEVSKTKNTVLINPGQMMGENNETGFIILDCITMNYRRVFVGKSMFEHEIDIVSETDYSVNDHP